MAKRKRGPEQAFEAYLAMGPERSFIPIAEDFDVPVIQVARWSASHAWAERLLREHVAGEPEESSEALAEAAEIVRLDENDIKAARRVRAAAAKALKGMTFDSAIEAVKAGEIAMKLERQIRGRGRYR